MNRLLGLHRDETQADILQHLLDLGEAVLPSTATICGLGNGLAAGSDLAGKGSLAFAAGGVGIMGFSLLGGPGGVAASSPSWAAAFKSSQLLGYGAAGSQFASGLLQGYATGDFTNSTRALYGVGLGSIATAFEATMPKPDQARRTRERNDGIRLARMAATLVGVGFAGSQQFDPNLAVKQVNCQGL